MQYASYLGQVKTKLKSPVVINIFWLSFDKVLRLLIGLVVGVWVARYLGPGQWGQLNYVLAIVGIVTAIANLGMDGFLIKEILERPGDKFKILGTAFVMRLIAVPLLAVVILGYFTFLDLPPLYYKLFAFLALNFCIVPLDLIDVEFQSKLQSRLTVVSKNLAYVIGAAAKIYLLVSQKPIIWFAAIMGFETLLAYIFLAWNYQRKYNLFEWRFSGKLVRSFIEVGWPFMISNLAVILYMRIDQVMIGNFSGTEQLGLFSSAAKVTDLFVFVPIAISSSFLPSLVKAKNEGGYKRFVSTLQFFLNWMMKVSLALAILVTIFSHTIIMVLYGPKFIEAREILIVHVWALIPMYLGVASGQYLVIENLQKYNLYKTLLGLALNVGLNIFLIPEYGANGAAIATLISYFVSAIFSNYLFKPTKPLFKYQLTSVKMLFHFDKKVRLNDA